MTFTVDDFSEVALLVGLSADMHGNRMQQGETRLELQQQ
jgi:hypothetical protein